MQTIHLVILNRFTDSLGTRIYANGIVIDWSTWNLGGATVRAYYNTLNAADTLTNQLKTIDRILRQVLWVGKVSSRKELTNVFNLSITRELYELCAVQSFNRCNNYTCMGKYKIYGYCLDVVLQWCKYNCQGIIADDIRL